MVKLVLLTLMQCVKDHPCVTITEGVHKLQDMAQKIHTLEETQEEAETQLRIATLVCSNTLPWMESSAGRDQQMAHGGLLSRHTRDM